MMRLRNLLITCLSIFALELNAATPTGTPFTALNGPFEGLTYVFYTADFGYSDGDGDPLVSIRVPSLPLEGTLYVDVNANDTLDAGEELSAGGSILVADLDIGNLQYITSGTTNTSFMFEVYDGEYSATSYSVTLEIVPKPTVSISLNSTTDSEPTGSVILTATLSNLYGTTVTTDLAFSGSAILASDYSVSSESIDVIAGATTGTVTIDIEDDDVVEGDEQVVIDIVSVMNGTENLEQQQTLTITDDDQATLSIVATTQASEDVSDGLFTISTDKQFSSSVTVDFTVSGTATSGTDYTSLGTSIVFPASTSSITLPLTVSTDDLVEGDETVIVTLTGTDNGDVSIGTTDEATITITDDDQATLSIVATTQASEDVSDGLFTISTDKQFSSSVTVDFTVSGTATSGTDYTSLGTSIVFPASTSSITLPLTVSTDDLVEGDETVIVTMTGTDNGDVSIGTTDEATITITDDDQSTLSIVATTQASEDVSDGLFTISTDKQFSSSVTVDFTVSGTATSGTDYTSLGTSIVFPASTSSITLPLTVSTDDLVEGDETVIVTLTGTDNGDVSIGTTDEATITITDDDQSTLSIVATTQASEDVSDGLFTISTDKQFSSSVTVDFTVSGTATSGTDYTSLGTSIVFPASTSSITLPLTVSSDDLVEGDETVIVTMTGTDNGDVSIGTTDEATITITDDDQATLSIVATTQASEDVSDGLFTISTDKQFSSSVTVDFTVSGTATSGTDYTSLGTSIVFPASTSSITLPLTVSTDDLVEGDETVIVTLTGTDNGDVSIGTTDEATITITDDDQSTLSIVATTQASEDVSDGLFTISTDKQFSSSVTVDFTVSGTATSGTDYTSLGTSIVFPASTSSITLPLTVSSDDLVEGDETVIVTMTGTDNGDVSIGTTDEATITITDDDQATLSIVATTQASEDVSDGLFTISTDKQFSSSVTVDFTVSGTATSGTDYTALGTSIVFPASTSSITLPLTVSSDDLVEGDETVIVTMTGTDNGDVSIGTTDEATITITDDDQATLSIVATTQASEDVSDGLFTISTDKQFSSSVTVDFTVSGTATSGTDYTALGTSIVFPANTSSITLPLTVSTDDLVEGDETVIVTMTGTDNGDVSIGTTDEATITITDDDQATLSIVATTQASEDVSDGLFTISTDKQFSSSVTVDFTVSGTATSGTDYTALGTSIVFPANTSSITLPLTVSTDDLVEGDETVIVTMTGTDNGDVSIGTTDEATITITDDDQATLSIVATTQASEDVSDGLFTISTDKQFSSSVTVDFTVSGTATSGTDYTALGTSIVFPASTSSITLPLTVSTDDLVEGDETVIVTLTGTDNGDVSIGTTDEATITITDDDQATLSIVATTQASEDVSDGLFTISTDKQFSSSVTVDFTVSGTATSGTDYIALGTSIVFPASTSSITLPLTVSTDNLVEGDETVIVTLTGTDNGDVSIGTTDEATITITDDDQATLSIVATTQASEDVSDGLFTISTDKQFSSSVTVDFTVSGTATSGTDYTALGTSIVFPANTSSITLPLTVSSDDLVEGDETVIVTLTGTDNGDVSIGTTDEATITITDDDQATLSIVATTQASEDVSDGLFTISTDKQISSSVTVDFTVSGTATSGTDYTSLGTSIVFPVNTSSITLPLTVSSDDLVEGDETVIVTLTGTDNGDVSIGTTDEATITITDDDQATLSIVATTQASEDVSNGLFTISTDKHFISSIIVSFAVSGTATSGTDYTSLGTSIVFPANTSSITLPLTVSTDHLVEGDETVIVTMTGTDNGDVSIGTTDEATITITDDDQATLSIVATTQSSEDDIDGLFTISTDKLFSNPVTVDIAVTGTAINGTDYTLIGSQVTFPANENTITIPVNVLSDDQAEGDETVVITLIGTDNSDVGIGITDEATIVITDNDAAALYIAATTQSSEDVTEGLFTVWTSILFSSSTEVTFEIHGTATEGIDYLELGTTFTFPANQNSVMLPISVIPDDLVEGDEQVSITLISTDNPEVTISLTNSAVITITDDDQATLSIVATTQASEDVSDGLFTISTDKQFSSSVTVDFTVSGTATSGTDYTALGTSIVFPASTSSITLPLTVSTDDLVEGDETVIVTMTGTDNGDVSIGTTDEATITITDDDQATLSIVATTQASEDVSDGLFTISTDKQFSSSVTVDFTVSGTATSGTDYTALGTSIVFPASTSSITLPLTVSTDDLVEGDETVIVTMTGTDNGDVSIGTTDEATITITDDDQATLSIVATTQASEDVSDGLFTISTDKQFSSSVTVDFTVSGTATSGTDYTSLGTSIVFPASTSSITLPLTVSSDDLVEGDETVIVTLTGTDNGDVSIGTTDEATITITDDDQATLSIVATNQASEDATNGLFTISTDQELSLTVSVEIVVSGTAISGTDYSSLGASFDFPANSLTTTIPVTVIPDDLAEEDETVIVTLVGTNNSNVIIGEPDIATITIINDDEAPVITPSQSFSVDENAINSTVIGTVVATDGDPGTVFGNWTILSGNDGSVFAIGANSGQLIVEDNTNLDFENKPDYTLQILVNDGNNNSTPQSVQIVVNDLNDNIPVITENQVFEVAETAASGFSIGDIKVQDADANTSFENWTIISGNVDNVFALGQNSGELIVSNNNTLNYEDRSQYILEVEVSDGINKSAIETIVIDVIDINDPPVAIILDNLSFTAYDVIGTTIGNLITLDEDDEIHTYSVIGNDHFTVNDISLQNNVVFTNKEDSVVTLTIRTEDAKGGQYETQFDITVFAFVDREGPNIADVSNPGTYRIGTGPLVLEATITDFALDEVSFYYRKLIDENFTIVSLTSSNQLYSTEVNDRMVEPSGIEYYFEARDTSRNVSKSKKFRLAITYPNDGENAVKVVLDNNRFGQDISNYQVISIPYILNDNDSRVDVLFDEYGGKPDNLTWRMIRFNNTTQKIQDIDGSYQVQLGEGYFFIAKEQKEIVIDNAVSNTQDSMIISLKKDWNLIGNPYNIDISWPSVLAGNDTEDVGPIRVIDPADPAAWPESTTLKAFEGAFVFALEDVDVMLDFKNSDKRIIDEYVVPEYEWFVPLKLSQASSKQTGGIGMHEKAEITFDKFDSPTLPRWIKYLDLNFPHPEHSYGRMSRDIVGITDSYTWEFQAESNLTGIATLEWPSESLDSLKQLLLLDMDNGQLIDMKNSGKYSFELSDHKKFKIFYSNDPNDIFVGDQVFIGDAYPNPFEKTFTIPLNLPELEKKYNVTFELFDLFGKQLKREEYTLDPGNHSLMISFENNLKSSLLIYEVVVFENDNLKRVQKKILIDHE